MEATSDPAAHALLRRVCRDLQVPVAMLVASSPRRSVVAHEGVRDISAIRALVAHLNGSGQVCDAQDLAAHGLRSHVQAAVGTEAVNGLLIAADRRRRWFCPDERRHLELLATRAVGVLSHAMPALDVRVSAPAPVPAVAVI